MDDSPAKLKIIPDHFQVPTSSMESPVSRKSSTTEPGTGQSSRYCSLIKKRIEEKYIKMYYKSIIYLKKVTQFSSV